MNIRNYGLRKNKYIFYFLDICRMHFIEYAMRRDTAAPSFLVPGVFCSVSASGARRFMLAVSLLDLVRLFAEPCLFYVDLRFVCKSMSNEGAQNNNTSISKSIQIVKH